MLKRYWSFRSALGIVAAIFIGLTLHAWLTAPTTADVLEVKEHDAADVDGEKEYAISYSPNRGIVVTASSNQSADPNKNIASSANPYPLSLGQRDLLAQERMSHWTQYLGFFTGVGVVLLALTLHETNETAKYARDMLDQQRDTDYRTLKAYLFPVNMRAILTPREIPGGRTAIDIEILFDWSLAGHTPANVIYECIYAYIRSPLTRGYIHQGYEIWHRPLAFKQASLSLLRAASASNEVAATHGVMLENFAPHAPQKPLEVRPPSTIVGTNIYWQYTDYLGAMHSYVASFESSPITFEQVEGKVVSLHLAETADIPIKDMMERCTEHYQYAAASNQMPRF